MKRFLFKIALFLLPLVILITLAEVTIRKIPNDYSLKNRYLTDHAHEIETLILGSSHTFRGLNPVYFESNTFNAAMVSQSLNWDNRIFLKYVDALSNLKTVIIPVSYSSLFGQLEKGKEAWRVKNYVIYYGLGPATSVNDYFEVLSNKVDINVKRIFSNYEGQSNISCSELGWCENSTTLETDVEKTGEVAAKRHTRENLYSDDTVQLYSENTRILNSIISECLQRNILVLLITTPALESYRKNLSQEQWDKTRNTAISIASNYNNCSYINLLDDSRFENVDFYDADHLNETGAQKLSLIINDKIRFLAINR